MSLSAILYLVGMALVFVGERLVPEPLSARLVFDGLAAALFVVSVGLRFSANLKLEGDAARAGKRALAFGLVGIGSLLVYVLGQGPVTSALGLSAKAATRVSAIAFSLWPIVWLAGTLAMILVDRVARETPRAVQGRRVAHATDTGLVVAFAVALAFPVNYLAAHHETHFDLRFVKTTSPGTATVALVESLDKPVKAVLFFPAANDVEARVQPYFDALAKHSKAFTVVRADTDLDPGLAKKMRVSSNGTVALSRGTEVERIDLGTDVDAARSALAGLDGTVQQKLLRLIRHRRVAYFTTGHDEATWLGDKLPRSHRLTILKQILQDLNYNVRPLSDKDGLGGTIPSDAAVVVVAGAKEPFLPEEVSSLADYADRGGHLFVIRDPKGKPDPALASLVGVQFQPGILNNDHVFMRATHTNADFALMVTNQFSSHASMSTLSRLAFRVAMFTPNTGWLSMKKGPLRVTDTVRSLPGTWVDLDGNHVFDKATEKRKIYTIAAAAQSAKKGDDFRGAALADVEALGDMAMRDAANRQYAADTFRWLTGDSNLQGTTESEKDVRITHTGLQDKLWFFGTTFGFPAIVLLAGIVRVSRRRRRSS